jgi:aminoglycoside N3'-acetyltransferase
MSTINSDHIKAAITNLGIENSIICLHSSLKSFGSLEMGPDSLIQAFLASGCTLVVPTFTYECDVPPPVEKRYKQNAYAYEDASYSDRANAYNINSGMISKSLGAIPARILQYKERIRGNHPLNSFTALGPKAEAIIASQSPLNVYGSLKQMYNKSDVYILLAGVDLTKATPIHFAEEKAGRRLFRRWAKSLDNSCIEAEVGSCSEGFENFSGLLAQIERRILVGSSLWRLFPFTSFIDIVSEAVRKDQNITHCSNPACERCEDAIKGGPILE